MLFLELTNYFYDKKNTKNNFVLIIWWGKFHEKTISALRKKKSLY